MTGGIEPVLFARARQLVAESTGFREDAISGESIERALRAELSRGRTPGDLIAELQRPDSEFSQSVVRATLVGETYFFRHPEHFRFLAREAAPAVLRGHPRRIRGWSAGCATGEEAYSLAACMLACASPGVVVEVLGTDLHEGSLDTARRAIYGSWSRRDSGPHLFPLYRPFGERQVIVIESVRSVTTFMAANLMAPLSGIVAPFDFILCRNVLTYFTPSARDAAIANIVRSLAPGGYLFLGTVEVDRPPVGVVRVGPPELQAFHRPLHPEAPTLPMPRAPSRTGLSAIPAVALTPVPLPPRRSPTELHLEALRRIEEGDEYRATAQLEDLVRQCPEYLPGLLELALLRERGGSRAAAYPLMRAVHARAARLPPDQIVEGPEALPARFYKASAEAYLNQQGAAE
ncbi:CheR family methyltransferase [Hyalangium rubrum]|uniref:CheR family methyltransferase n=1 Tax=Hyalangium rubrum TaxID=3103134 RepID=A0ABU5HFK8_9BACT|nr:CheR family methyltransferase [Hyalangium sp. s54d21]MDY7232050.1 CheR family methyltransferase [Hyalangium sp. s54d21]